METMMAAPPPRSLDISFSAPAEETAKLLLTILTREERDRLVGKTIVFIRHAESIYNIDLRSKREKRSDLSLQDACLTNLGRLQAEHLAFRLREICPNKDLNDFQLIVSSPLTRALQTAAVTFRSRTDRKIIYHPMFAEKVNSYSDTERDLDVCKECHVELQQFDWYESRSRRCRLPNGDPLPSRWSMKTSQSGSGQRYPYEDGETTKDRVKRCWQWLSDRDEQFIAIVTHSGIIGGSTNPKEGKAYGLLRLNSFVNAESCVVRIFP